jgi:suppressor of tumorigenicity protein 13
VQGSFVVEESDDDMADIDGGKGNADEEVEEDDILESDIDLEGETVEPDSDPPQKVFLFELILHF